MPMLILQQALGNKFTKVFSIDQSHKSHINAPESFKLYLYEIHGLHIATIAGNIST